MKNMTKLKDFLNNQWFFPILILYYGIFYIFFGETYPFNGGYSTDGFVFASFIPNPTKSHFFDTYYVHRILPSLLVGVFFKIFSISSTELHIFTAFQILNVISIALSCYFLKQILLLFKVSLKNQLLAFTLFLLNFGVLKFPFYLAVMTDTFALMLSTALLYFFFKKNIVGVIIVTLLLAFTWLMGFYQGLILIAFPFCILPFSPPLKWQKNAISGTFVSYILAVTIFFIFINNKDTCVEFVAKIDRDLLLFSILSSVVFYFFLAKLFLNKTLLDYALFFKKINYKNLLISASVYISVLIIIHFLNPNPISMYSLSHTLSGPAIYSLIKPLISFVAHTSYFGIVVCLLIIFWSSFCKTVSQLGWGIVAALGLNLFLFGITPESRQLINILPWIIIFLVVAINKYSFSNRFYIVVGLLSFAASKIWLLLNIYAPNSTLNLDENGSIGFPSQILWMNIGPWMSEQMYYVQGAIMVLFVIILFFTLYKIKFIQGKKISLIRNF